MRNRPPARSDSSGFVPSRRYRSLRGKVVDWVDHKFEEGVLYLDIRFTDKTELCWRIAAHATIEVGDLSDWGSGNFEQLKTFVRNQRDSQFR